MHSRQTILLALAVAATATGPSLAGPNNGTVVSGNATIQGQGSNSVVINQSSQNAIINWQTFNIGNGQTVQIAMPNSSSAELDRVIGNLGPSQILGSLTSNGRVFLVNPNGILFGQGAQINVGSLLATTSNIGNADFMAGRYNFSIPGNPSASIVNQGTITAKTGGFAALVAPGVRNTGTITAWLGRVGLASANTFALDLYGDRLIQLNVDDSIASQVIDVSTGQPLKSLVSNEGKLKANGGTVQLTAVAARAVVDSVINNSGVIEANSIGTHNGMIVLSAATAGQKPSGAPTQTVTVSGKLSAAGKRKGTTGGTVLINGENIALNGAAIDASGNAGGGTVLIGGNGSSANGTNANASSANSSSASGSNGLWDGGPAGAAPWSSLTASSSNPNTNLGAGLTANPAAGQTTNQAANQSLAAPTASNASTVTIDAATVIDASATVSGNGGKVTVWSDLATAFYGTILARGGAQGGNGGFVETSGGTLAFTGTVNTSAPNGTTGTWLLDPVDLTIGTAGAAAISSGLANNNVVVFTDGNGNASTAYGTTASGSGNITINAPISWSSSNTLTIDAYNAIIFNASINVMGAGGLALMAAPNPLATAAPLISFNNGASVQFTGTPNTGQSLTIDGQAYTLLYSMSDVQNINNSSTSLSGSYALAMPLNASGVTNWTPIGTSVDGTVLNSGNGFTGAFQGLGNTISNLTLYQPSAQYVGLLGYTGRGSTVENIGLLGGSMTGSNIVGSLIAWNAGTATNIYATSSVTGSSDVYGNFVGGLIGFNIGTVANAYATGLVSGGYAAGGLTGVNDNTVTNSYATGMVSGTAEVGGLIGSNDGSANSVYATGGVSGSGALGGLIGVNFVTVNNAYATGAVAGSNPTDNVGGLIGENATGAIASSYATGTVTGSGNLGGLVGANNNGIIEQSYSTSLVTGTSGSANVGGLVGENVNGGSVTQSYASGAVTGGSNVGGLIGYNNNSGIITQTYATGAVSGGSIVGGLIGFNYDGTVSNSYATGTVSGTSEVGGLIGTNGNAGTGGTVTNAYSTGAVTGTSNVGGLVGFNNGGSITSSYWDTQTTGMSVGLGGSNGGTFSATGLTTAQFGNSANFVGWNFGTTPGGSGWVIVDSDGSLNNANGANGATRPMLLSEYSTTITNAHQLQLMALAPNANYTLANNIDLGPSLSNASDVWGPNGSAGFVPIGNLAGISPNGSSVGHGSNAFSGTFNGQGYTISNLKIDLPTNSAAGDETGLFGAVASSGVIENVSLVGASVSGEQEVGALAGWNNGTITNSSASGAVTGNYWVGGLVGNNSGDVAQSYSSATVNGSQSEGGLVGNNAPTGVVTQSFATGSVSGSSCSCNVGGLVGWNYGIVSDSYATGSVSGAISVGGLVGVNSTGVEYGYNPPSPGLITQSYATGLVSSSGAGLVGFNSIDAQVSTSYWDTTTTGRANGVGANEGSFSATGLTTAQLTSGLPSGFDATVWGSNGAINNGYPFLLWHAPTGSLVVDGYVYSDAGVTLVGSGITVNGLVNGVALSSLDGTVTTGANGSYNFVLVPGTISVSGSQVLTYTTGSNAGAAYVQNATGSITDLNIYEGYLNETSGAGTLSAISSGLVTAIGSNSSVQTLVNGLQNRTINATASNFTIDQPLSAGTLLLSSSGTVTQSAAITATNLSLLGSGGSFTLTNSGNQISALAANAGNVNLTDSTNLSVGTVAGTSGVTATGAFTLNVNGSIGATTAVDVGSFTLQNGNWSQVDATLPNFAAQNFTVDGGSFLRAAGGLGTADVPYQIVDVYGLQGIGSSATLLAANYVLGNNIDASSTANWNGGAGFVPIGLNTNFTGTFNGNGNTISGLIINQATGNGVGLFGTVGPAGMVENVGLVGGSVTASDASFSVGALIGFNNGAVDNVYATSTVTSSGPVTMGGLIGINTGTVTDAYASGAVSGGVTVGGLIGSNSGSVSSAYATGAVSGVNAAGGLIGINLGNVSSVYATGAVSSNNGTGGLIGYNDGQVTNAYATGAVVGNDSSSVGGLIGTNDTAGTVTNAHATNTVSGVFGDVGGLIGSNSGTAINDYATSTVNGLDSVGGLIGYNNGSVTNVHATSAVTGEAIVGGLIGTNDVNGTVTNSYAGGAVNGGTFATAGGLVGINAGAITQSYAMTGTVTVGNHGIAGGLVGINGNCCDVNGNPMPGASITNSYAAGAVSSSGIDVQLGGLAGENLPGALISNSQAYGNVSSTANLQPNNGNCISNCQYADVGGFVGANYGTITGASWSTTPVACAASFACAGGAVSVGSQGQGGGFAGFNSGIINFAFATGNLSGAAGQPSVNGVFNNTTQLGGFVGDNQGMISNAFATGTVGTAGTQYLSVGGFTGSNEGTISTAFATGAVLAGDNSTAGGFVGGNSPNNSSTPCPGCYVGDGYNNNAAISNAQASGNVTVGASSVAGGFAAASVNDNDTGGRFTNVTASGAVTAGQDSMVGGLIGVLGLNSTLSDSSAQNTLVASSGPNSIVGGIVGISFGTISNTTSTAPVSGTGDSYIGGVAGINLGSLNNVAADPAIAGTGGNDFIGGIAGLNLGSIDGSSAQVAITSVSSSYVGGITGVNGSFSNVTGTIPGSSFPNGTIANSSASGSGFSGNVGTQTPSFTPALPAWLSNCTSSICSLLVNGSLQPNNAPNTPPPNNTSPTQQTAQLTQNVNFASSNNTAPPVITLVDINNVTNGGNGNPASGGNGNGGNGNGGNGALANGKHGGNGAPPGMRLIDMPHMPLPPGTGLPPLNETRFLSNQLVLQFDTNNLTPQQISALAARFGLTVVAQQTIGMLGRTVYTFSIGNGQSVRDVIRLIEASGLKVAVQPQYTYGLTQGGTAADQGETGDPAQYIVQKLQLAAAHRISKGANVVIAVIDSAIDAEQPDFAGGVIDRYDAGCGSTAPDAHGTGMAGAIASHVQLVGVAPAAKIIAICAFGGSSGGGTPEATSVKIIRGLDYAVQHGAKIVNMSFAGPYDPALAQALQIAREKGVLIVAAAGNAGAKSPPLYPGADPNVLAVTATDENDQLFIGANQGNYVALAAPGVNILVPAPDGGVQMTTGTSVATANVSGVAALLLADKPSRTPERIRAILVATAKHLGAKGVNPQFGAGLVDPIRALQAVPPVAGRKSAAAAPVGQVQ